MPKAVLSHWLRTRHNWPRPLIQQPCVLPLDHCDLQRHVGTYNLPKVVTRQRGGRESNSQPSELPVQRPKPDYRSTQRNWSPYYSIPIATGHGDVRQITVFCVIVNVDQIQRLWLLFLPLTIMQCLDD